MKKIILLAICIIATLNSHAQQFIENTDIELNGILYGEAKWINIDNDSDIELITSGYDIDYNKTSAIYSYQPDNIGETDIPIENFSYSNIETLDYNNDGYTDFIINGLDSGDVAEVLLYINDTNGSFIAQELSISGTSSGQMKIEDFNHDDLSDIIITGIDSNYNYVAHLYIQQSDGTFEDSTVPFFGNSFGSILAFDANNDSHIDVVITGFSNNYVPETKLYINDGNAVFTEQTDSGIADIYFSSLSAADYDNDGDEDVLISGFDSTYKPFSLLYNNDSEGNFTVSTDINLAHLYWGATSFVDYDNDGDLDIFISGADENTFAHVKFYNNVNNVFTEDTNISTGMYATYNSSADWSDYDSDGDLDLVLSGLNSNHDPITKVYINQQESLSVNDVTMPTTFSIQPNPTTNKTLNLVYDESLLNSDLNTITIYSTLGHKVYETTLLEASHVYKKQLDLSFLERGIYMVQFTLENQMVTEKFILK